jgi:hypothetical protein
MYRKFDVTRNLLFAQYFFFFDEVNTAILARLQSADPWAWTGFFCGSVLWVHSIDDGREEWGKTMAERRA